MAQLSGKAALVTGASRGIGAAIAKRLAADGAAVAITYASSPEKANAVVEEIKKSGGTAVAIQADSGDAEGVKRAVRTAVENLGRLDILVNNAGVAFMAPIGEFPEVQFERLLSVNVRGVFTATNEAVRHMGDGGRIIMIGSANSDSMPFVGGSVYAMTKAAVAGFVHGLARDLGPRGITVNNIQPGPVDTDMNPSEGEFAEMLKRTLAIKRYGKAEEVAAMVSYLAGPEAGYVTGGHFKIDGGFAA